MYKVIYYKWVYNKPICSIGDFRRISLYGIYQEVTGQMKIVVTDKWILCPVCKAKTRTQILDDTELKHFPLFCPKCKENFIINVKDHIVDYQSIARR